MNPYHKKILMCIAALACSVAALSLTGGKRVWAPLTSRALTTQGGLPSNRMNDMVQDATGYIWLGTANGLCRYDGYAFVTFHAQDADTRSMTDNVGHVAPRHPEQPAVDQVGYVSLFMS